MYNSILYTYPFQVLGRGWSIIIIIIIINNFYNAHNTLQGMSLCAVRKKRLGGGTVQVHDIIEIIQIGRFLKQT